MNGPVEAMDTESVHRSLGLTDEEAARIEEILGRPPSSLELAMYAVMWSEHCSYKSSRVHLRRLPSEAPHVLVGPGENAGVIDAGDGIAVAIRIESHNHPSAVEPYQGAATGAGGILRDIFTMGARPIALMDPLFFGPLDDARSRWTFEGVVGGIAGYGNAVGVPTVGGELTFSPCYARNPLVNVLCVGVMPRERLVLGAATGEGNLAVLLGASTGRDGIGGVSVLASASFGAAGDDAAKRPSVQVGDPFEEKRLIEACLELLDASLVVGIQDLGGAGLACATSETAARAGMGMDVDTSAVPRRQEGMEPFEVMTSESQERMLAIVAPGDLEEVMSVCRRHEVTASVVGVVTPPIGGPDGPVGRLRVRDGDGPVLADVPAASLSDDAPLYHRPMAPPAERELRLADDPAVLAAPEDCGADLLALLELGADPSWVYRQYDHQLFLNTVVGPGGDATVLRLQAPGLPPSKRALALSTDSNHRWCAVDPRGGTAAVVAEAALQVACAGAKPAALVNCLNFGDPEHPEVMWALSEAVDGMAGACRALSVPVVGGNVSLYNASSGVDIDPTPVVGVLGVIERLERRPPPPVLVDGEAVVLLGATSGELGGSAWAVDLRGHAGGHLPALDLEAHARVVGLVASLVAEVVANPVAGEGPEGLVLGIHDVSAGGLGVALGELAIWSGVGAHIDPKLGAELGVEVGGVPGHARLFSESHGRVVLCTRTPEALLARAEAAGVPASVIGTAGGSRLIVDGLLDLEVEVLARAWRSPVPAALGEPVPAGLCRDSR